ncbi:hypothetical protein [Pedosphaera parvula]|uniref:Uncharacterized protein n=1 Tax=Pedosphaera parvula (strain Ellin514) TaxID=320771 RepID=B9XMM4_PEDPL|nr:hypothetical protein [Pedosphaera parvula]EEF58923.1 hypothetical protein Cflav_PD2925 [Pedosphaera parvula Ellin514]
MKQARSTIALDNIEEVIGTESSAEWATLAGQQQYFTPNHLRDYCVTHLHSTSPATIIDPQCGSGTAEAFKDRFEQFEEAKATLPPSPKPDYNNPSKLWQMLRDNHGQLFVGRGHWLGYNLGYG